MHKNKRQNCYQTTKLNNCKDSKVLKVNDVNGKYNGDQNIASQYKFYNRINENLHNVFINYNQELE